MATRGSPSQLPPPYKLRLGKPGEYATFKQSQLPPPYKLRRVEFAVLGAKGVSQLPPPYKLRQQIYTVFSTRFCAAYADLKITRAMPSSLSEPNSDFGQTLLWLLVLFFCANLPGFPDCSRFTPDSGAWAARLPFLLFGDLSHAASSSLYA